LDSNMSADRPMLTKGASARTLLDRKEKLTKFGCTDDDCMTKPWLHTAIC